MRNVPWKYLGQFQRSTNLLPLKIKLLKISTIIYITSKKNPNSWIVMQIWFKKPLKVYVYCEISFFIFDKNLKRGLKCTSEN